MRYHPSDDRIIKANLKRLAMKSAESARPSGYEVMNLKTHQSHGVYDSLDQAKGCVSYDRLTSWQIWHGQQTLVAERDLS